MSLKTVLFNDEKTKKGQIGGAAGRVLIGVGVGVAQGYVESNDRVIAGMKLSTLTPTILTLAGIAGTMFGKHDTIRNIAGSITVAGSVILGKVYVAPQINKLITHSSSRILNRGRGTLHDSAIGATKATGPYGYINTGLYG